MVNVVNKECSKYIKYMLSCILGFLSISIAFIVFKQNFIYLGTSAIRLEILLLSIFGGLCLGFVIVNFYADFFRKKIKFLLLFTAIWLSCFLSSLYFEFLGRFFPGDAAFYLFILMAPLILFLLLGIVMALLLSKSNATQSVELAMVALGLMLGLLITEFFTLTFNGSSWVIFLDTCLLVVCALIIMDNFIQEIITSSLMVAIILIAFAMNIQVNSISIPMSFSELMFANINFNTHDQYPYIPLIEKIIYQDLKLHDQNILVMGEGIIQLKNADKSNIHFTYFNEASNALPSACTYLAVLSKGNQILAAKDKQLSKQTQVYKTIIANIFPNNKTIPTALMSYQHLQEIRNALPEDGIAIFNVYASPMLTDLYSKRIDNTIHAVFPSCMEIPLAYGIEPTNIIYVCHKSDEETDNNIYTSTIF